MFNDMTDEEKELANFCAEYAENGDSEFSTTLEWTVAMILANPDVMTLKIGIKSYAALVLMFAIEKGKSLQEESLISQLFKKAGK